MTALHWSLIANGAMAVIVVGAVLFACICLNNCDECQHRACRDQDGGSGGRVPKPGPWPDPPPPSEHRALRVVRGDEP